MVTMKFGVQIENHLGVTYNGVRKVALQAEKSGFDGLFICDHLMEGMRRRSGSRAWTHG